MDGECRRLGRRADAHRLGEIRLRGSGATGLLRANTGAVAAAAADSRAESEGVESATGRAFTDRGLPTIAVTATLEPLADLAAVRESAERVRSEIAQVLDGAQLATRVHLHVGRARPPPPPTAGPPGPASAFWRT